MLTPQEEAVGRLHGLRHVAQLGKPKAIRSLAEELAKVATADELAPELGQKLIEASDLVVAQVAGRGGKASKANSDRMLARLDEIIAAVNTLIEDPAEPVAAAQPSDASEPLQSAEAEPTESPTPNPASDEAANAAPDAAVAAAADPQMLTVFISEANEHLDTAEQHLLGMESAGSLDGASLDAVFRAFHSVKGNAAFLELSETNTLAHEAETLLDMVRGGQAVLDDNVSDLSLRAIDALRALVATLDGAADAASISGVSQQAAAIRTDLAAAVKALEAGEPLSSGPAPDKTAPPATADETSSPPPAAADETPPAAGRAEQRRLSEGDAMVRVARSRLDELINLSGELLIAETMVNANFETIARRADCGAVDDSPMIRLRKISRELQQLSLSLRMVPVTELFNKQSRLVRDLSRKLNKKVRLEIEGGDAELDRNVIDQLADPMVHIIRNAVDHGVEPNEQERIDAGKPAEATIRLTAAYRGGNIFIAISDDGRGLNRERVLSKAIDRGVVDADSKLTDHETDRLILHPGLSTAESLSDVSGRGVGMDVVAKNVESLRGDLDVKSEPGHGTEITLTLPLTLSIVDGVVVRVGKHRLVIPNRAVLQVIKSGSSEFESYLQHGSLLRIKGQTTPVVKLGDLYGFRHDPTEGDTRVVVLVFEQGRLRGLVVDELVGQQQVVIKSLGDAVGQIPGIAGAAVMPDGQVALIVDPTGLSSLARGAALKVERPSDESFRSEE